MIISFLAALLKAAARLRGEPAPHVPRGAKSPRNLWAPEPVKPPEVQPGAPGPEPEPAPAEDWWSELLEEPKPEPDYPRTPIDGFMRFGQWLDCSHSTNVEAIQYLPDTEELNVIYQDKPGRRGARCWSYGSIGWELAYEIATAEALGITPLGNLSTSGKGYEIWNHIRVRGPGNRGRHQVPARPNPGLLAQWQATRQR